MKILATIGTLTISIFLAFFSFWLGDIDIPSWAEAPRTLTGVLTFMSAIAIAIRGSLWVWLEN